MKIPKKVIHIICAIFEATFLVISILSIVYVSGYLSFYANAYPPARPTTETLCLYAALIMTPLVLLIATAIIHALCSLSPKSSHEQELGETKRQNKKHRQIAKLESKLQNLKQDEE